MVNRYIANQREVPPFPADATNVLFLHYDQYNIYDHVMCNQLTIRVAMVILHLESEAKSLVAVLIVMHLLFSTSKTFVKKIIIIIISFFLSTNVCLYEKVYP